MPINTVLDFINQNKTMENIYTELKNQMPHTIDDFEIGDIQTVDDCYSDHTYLIKSGDNKKYLISERVKDAYMGYVIDDISIFNFKTKKWNGFRSSNIFTNEIYSSFVNSKNQIDYTGKTLDFSKQHLDGNENLGSLLAKDKEKKKDELFIRLVQLQKSILFQNGDFIKNEDDKKRYDKIMNEYKEDIVDNIDSIMLKIKKDINKDKSKKKKMAP